MNLDDSIRSGEANTGSFDEVSERAQAIKFIMRQGRNWDKMSIANKEAMESIATYIAMILSGNDIEPSHWNGLAAYARVRGKALEPKGLHEVPISSQIDSAAAAAFNLATNQLNQVGAQKWLRNLKSTDGHPDDAA